MKVLITGGAGFIGSNLADRLIARGDEVCIIDNFTTGRYSSIPPDAYIFRADIVKFIGAGCSLCGFEPDVIVHAAASYKDPRNWRRDIETNVLGTAMVAGWTEAPRIIYFQTALSYGLEPAQHPISLDCPIDPGGSSYSITKTAGEQFIELSGKDFVSFRLANIYGPRNLTGAIPTFYKRLSEGQKCHVAHARRDYVYIDDLLDVVVQAVDGKGHGYYHISSGADYTIEEVFRAVAAEMGLNPDVEVTPRGPDDARSLLLDPSETRKVFGWRASTSLDEGVARAVEYYREYGIEETFTHLKEPYWAKD